MTTRGPLRRHRAAPHHPTGPKPGIPNRPTGRHHPSTTARLTPQLERLVFTNPCRENTRRTTRLPDTNRSGFHDRAGMTTGWGRRRMRVAGAGVHSVQGKAKNSLLFQQSLTAQPWDLPDDAPNVAAPLSFQEQRGRLVCSSSRGTGAISPGHRASKKLQASHQML